MLMGTIWVRPFRETVSVLVGEAKRNATKSVFGVPEFRDRLWVWLKIKQEGPTAGLGPCFQCFHLPGFHFGTGVLSHSQHSALHTLSIGELSRPAVRENGLARRLGKHAKGGVQSGVSNH